MMGEHRDVPEHVVEAVRRFEVIELLAGAHAMDRHVHFLAGDYFPRPGVCTKPDWRCEEAGWLAYDPVEMKP